MWLNVNLQVERDSSVRSVSRRLGTIFPRFKTVVLVSPKSLKQKWNRFRSDGFTSLLRRLRDLISLCSLNQKTNVWSHVIIRRWLSLPLCFSHKNKMSGWPPPGPGSWGGLQGPPYSWDSMNSTREGRDGLTRYLQFDRMCSHSCITAGALMSSQVFVSR